jgi:hypothetical protein
MDDPLSYLPQSNESETCLQALLEEISQHVALALSRPCPVYANEHVTRVEFLDSMAWVMSRTHRAIYLEVRDVDGTWQRSQLSFNILKPLSSAFWLDQALLPWIQRIERIFGGRAVDAHWQLRQSLEHHFHHADFLKATSRQIGYHMVPEPALLEVIRLLRRWKPKLKQNNETYCSLWEEESVWTNLARFYPQLVHLYYLARSGGLLEAGAGLGKLRSTCLELGLNRAGWRFLSQYGEAAYKALVPRGAEIDFALTELLAYVDWQARANIAGPFNELLGVSAHYYGSVQDEESGQCTYILDPRLARAHQDYRDAKELSDDEEEEYQYDWSRVLMWMRDHRPEFDRNQWRAGWPAILKAYKNWLLLQPDQLQWSSLLEPFTRGKWRIKPLTGSNQLAVEGMRMKHCVAGYAEQCHEGEYRVFAIEKAESGKPTATVGLKKAGDGWALDQVQGKFNRKAGKKVSAVAKKILKRAN